VYRMSTAISLVRSSTGLLIPAYSRPDRNSIFIHLCDRNNIITEFCPYYSIGHYETDFLATDIYKDIGYPAPILFRLQGELLSFSCIEKLKYWAQTNQYILNKYPLIKSQIGRFTGLSLGEIYQDWKEAGELIFKKQKTKNNWVNSEVKLFQEYESAWTSIENKVIVQRSSHSKGWFDYTSLDKSELMEYLLDADSLPGDIWGDCWVYYDQRYGIDELLFEAGYDWLSSIFASSHEKIYDRSDIISRMILWEYASYIKNASFRALLGDLFCDGLEDAVKSGFPFHFHKMAVELSLHDMSFDEQLDFLEACAFFFNADGYASSFFSEQLVSLLESSEKDTFNRELSDIIDLIESMKINSNANMSKLNKLRLKFRD
jgi:hypothetical protein